MSSFSSAVLSVAIPSAEWRTFGEKHKCGGPVADFNSHASNQKTHARMLVPPLRKVCKRTSLSTYPRHFIVSGCVDQSKVLAGKNYPNRDIDDDNAAESAAEMAEETIRGVANDRSEQTDEDGSSSDQIQHPESSGNVLEGVKDSAVEGTKTMQTKLQRVGEYVTGSGECDMQASQNSGDAQDGYRRGLQEKLDQHLNWKGEALEEERHSVRSDNNAAESAEEIGREAVEAVNGLDQTGQQEPEDTSAQDDESSDDFGDQARRLRENVQEQTHGLVDAIKSGASKASEQVQAAGRDMKHIAENAFGHSNDIDEDDETVSKILTLRSEDFEEAYIEIDDGSAKESILL